MRRVRMRPSRLCGSFFVELEEVGIRYPEVTGLCGLEWFDEAGGALGEGSGFVSLRTRSKPFHLPFFVNALALLVGCFQWT